MGLRNIRGRDRRSPRSWALAPVGNRLRLRPRFREVHGCRLLRDSPWGNEPYSLIATVSVFPSGSSMCVCHPEAVSLRGRIPQLPLPKRPRIACVRLTPRLRAPRPPQESLRPDQLLQAQPEHPAFEVVGPRPTGGLAAASSPRCRSSRRSQVPARAASPGRTWAPPQPPPIPASPSDRRGAGRR